MNVTHVLMGFSTALPYTLSPIAKKIYLLGNVVLTDPTEVYPRSYREQ